MYAGKPEASIDCIPNLCWRCLCLDKQYNVCQHTPHIYSKYQRDNKKSDSNLSVLMSLDGEPGWVCLMCCNCDSEYRFTKPVLSE